MTNQCTAESGIEPLSANRVRRVTPAAASAYAVGSIARQCAAALPIDDGVVHSLRALAMVLLRIALRLEALDDMKADLERGLD